MDMAEMASTPQAIEVVLREEERWGLGMVVVVRTWMLLFECCGSLLVDVKLASQQRIRELRVDSLAR